MLILLNLLKKWRRAAKMQLSDRCRLGCKPRAAALFHFAGKLTHGLWRNDASLTMAERCLRPID